MSAPVWSGWLPPESLALLAAATWATASLFSAAASARMGAFAFTRWRMVFAALLLWGMALATGQWRSLWGDGGSAAWQAIGLLVLSGVIGIFVGDTALFACMNRLGPRRSGLLFATHSLFTVVLASLFLDESLKGWAVPGGVLLVGGVMAAIALGRREGAAHQLEATQGQLAAGVALGLLSALGQSVGTLVLKPAMAAGLDPVAASAVRMTAGFACHALLWCTGLQMARVQSALQWRDLAYTFASAALAMALGMTLILKALQHGSAGLVGMLSSVSPVLLLPLLWWRTGQRPAWGAWLGAAMAVVGCALILA